MGKLGQLAPDLVDILIAQDERGEIGLGEVAVVGSLLFAPHGDCFELFEVKAHGRLGDKIRNLMDKSHES